MRYALVIVALFLAAPIAHADERFEELAEGTLLRTRAVELDSLLAGIALDTDSPGTVGVDAVRFTGSYPVDQDAAKERLARSVLRDRFQNAEDTELPTSDDEIDSGASSLRLRPDARMAAEVLVSGLDLERPSASQRRRIERAVSTLLAELGSAEHIDVLVSTTLLADEDGMPWQVYSVLFIHRLTKVGVRIFAMGDLSGALDRYLP